MTLPLRNNPRPPRREQVLVDPADLARRRAAVPVTTPPQEPEPMHPVLWARWLTGRWRAEATKLGRGEGREAW